VDPDTHIGGPNAKFPDTRQSAILAARSPDRGRRNISHEAIVSGYWKPVYHYIRIKYGRSNEDAKDLTQSFFTLAIDKNFAAGYDPSKSAFRTYLRTCLDRFLSNRHKYEGRLKRSAPLLPLDDDVPGSESPEECFQREWTRTMFARAVDLLRERVTAEGKPLYFEVFERYDLAEPRPTYEQLARDLGVTAATVTNYLAAARRQFRAIVLDELHGLTASDLEFRREARLLLGGS
jgi:RNA polymerase sigma factor (sigma-70 family)